MTHEQFIYWLKGYLTAQASSQMKIELEKAIKEVDETCAPSPIGVNPWTSPYPTTITPGQPTTLPGQPFWYSTPGTTCRASNVNGVTITNKKEVLNG
jgi:hypothetical protein